MDRRRPRPPTRLGGPVQIDPEAYIRELADAAGALLRVALNEGTNPSTATFIHAVRGLQDRKGDVFCIQAIGSALSGLAEGTVRLAALALDRGITADEIERATGLIAAPKEEEPPRGRQRPH